ncbi:TlpA family protein disulfide reductase [Pedobacter sp.]|uniref:TlpA family protein disulfide reductase n=1 Tax=Pedobacter sp. TaxID=1411316 RepID=UPI00396C602B
MKKLIIFLTLFAVLKSYGQTIPKLDQNTIVKDSTGMIYPYVIWKKMTEKGEYSLKGLKNKESDQFEFFIYKTTDEEKLARKKRSDERASTLPKPRTAEVFKEGSKFNAEKFRDLNGTRFDMKKETGKIYVLNFWFINCPPCKAEIPDLNELVEKYKENKDVVFLAIALDDATSLKSFLKQNPFKYNIIDDGRYYSEKYGVRSYPTHVIIGKDGLIKFSTYGLASNTVYWVDKTIKEQIEAEAK